MSKYDIRPQFECQNRILNVKIQQSASVHMSIFSNVEIQCFAIVQMSK